MIEPILKANNDDMCLFFTKGSLGEYKIAHKWRKELLYQKVPPHIWDGRIYGV
jgi:hypothetical protein